MSIRRFCLALATAGLAAVAGARDIYVSPTGNDGSTDPTNPQTPYKTVDKGIASATGGDTVHIAAGTYAEGKSWTLAAAVTVAGEGNAKTILKNCQIILNHAEAVVQDLRLTGRNGSGTITFAKNGAGGTARRCDISGNTRTSTNGTGVEMYVGNLVDCTITNNVNSDGGRGVGLYVAASGDCLVENCLIADNTVGGAASGVGGVYVLHNVNGKNVTLRHCTITRNIGGDVGGLYLGGNVNIRMEDCLVSDNFKMTAETATNTEDAFLGWAKNYTRVLKNCLIARCPTYDVGYDMTGSLLNVTAGVSDPYANGNTIERASAAWGGATDGTDIGCFQTDHGDRFAVSCYAVTNRGISSVTTTLVGTSVNAEGDVTYEWDLDGDGVYEQQGASVEATFETVGWNSVKVKATCGTGSDAATVEKVVLVTSPTTYVWASSPAPTFPYATWETAAHDPHVGIAATLRGGKLQFTNEVHMLEKALVLARPIEFCGTGKDNNSSGNTSPLYWNLGKLPVVDAQATGTALVRKSADTSIALVGDGSLVHSLVMAVGRTRNCSMYGESVISNCTIRYGSFTAGSGCGINYSAGLVTHCVISNNYCSNDSTKGVQLSLSGTARLRNSLVTGGVANSTGSKGGCLGAIYASGNNVKIENCTICGNTVGKGGGIYTIGTVTVRNCIVRDNSALTDSATKCICNSDGMAVIENCNLDVAARKEDQPDPPPGFIIDPMTGLNTWTFGTASPCADKGAEVDWATNDSLDLFGNKRVSGEAIDIGCFEVDMSQATCDISADPAVANEPTNVTFSAVVTGKTLSDDAQCLWDFDGDGTFEASGKSVVHPCGEGYQSAILKIVENDVTVFCVTGKTDLVNIYPRILYYDSANAVGAKYPYNTPETAAAKIADAMGATSEDCELRILGGKHNCEGKITVDKRMTICPAPGLAERPTLARNFSDQLLVVGAEGAVVRDLDLQGGSVGGGNISLPSFVSVTAGTICNCALRKTIYTTGSGICLVMTGGLVDRCEIAACRGTTSLDKLSVGSAVLLTGSAILRNSLVTGCYIDSNSSGRKGGLVALKDNSVMENCTIAGNTNRMHSVVVCMDGGGTVRNCVISDNECGSGDEGTSPYWPSLAFFKGEMVPDWASAYDADYNCYEAAEAYGEHDRLGSARFRNPARKNYALKTSSPAYRSALLLPEWMTPDTLDLRGQPRLWEGKCDCGAIQTQRGSGMMLLVR